MRQDDGGTSVPKISHIALITSDARACVRNISIPYSLNISREKTFTDFTDLWVTSEILTLKILSCITILYCFYNPRNIYRENTESHVSTRILTLEIFRLYGYWWLTRYHYQDNKIIFLSSACVKFRCEL